MKASAWTTALYAATMTLATAETALTATLSLNTPTISVAPGATSAEIFATLTLGTGETLKTDASGDLTLQYLGQTYPYSTLSFVEASSELVYLPPYTGQELFFTTNVFSSGDPRQLDNLDVPPGSSVQFDLGRIAVPAEVPAGDYTTTLGVFESPPSPCPSYLVDAYCTGFVASTGGVAPTYGASLTVMVAAPEPGTLACMSSGLAAAAAFVRRRRA